MPCTVCCSVLHSYAVDPLCRPLIMHKTQTDRKNEKEVVSHYANYILSFRTRFVPISYYCFFLYSNNASIGSCVES